MILFANFYFKIFVLCWKSVSLKEIHTLRWISKLSVLRPSFSTWRQGLTSQYLSEGSQHDKCDIKISHKIVFLNLSGKNFSTCSHPMATLILLLLQGFLQSRLRKGANKTITVGLFWEKEIPIFIAKIKHWWVKKIYTWVRVVKYQILFMDQNLQTTFYTI